MNRRTADIEKNYLKHYKSAHLAQDQRPVSFFLTYDKFMSAQRHAFAHARDKKGVCNRQESKVLTETEVLGVKEDDRLIRERGKSRINARNEV
jgi:hypothetical protein